MRQAGFGLVELMIGVLIGLIGIAAMMSAFANTERYKRKTVASSNAYSAGTMAMLEVERDIKAAGFGFASEAASNCLSAQLVSSISSSPQLVALAPGGIPLRLEFGANSSDSDRVVTFSGTSQIRLVPARLLSPFGFAQSALQVSDSAGFSTGDVVLVASGTQCAFMQVSNTTPGTISVQPGSTVPLNELIATSSSPSFPTGTFVFNLGNPRLLLRYVVPSQGMYSLEVFRSVLGQDEVSLRTDQVVALRAQYGKDTDSDGTADTFDRTQPSTAAEWRQVVSVRVALLVRADHEEKAADNGTCTATTSSPTWSGGSLPVPGGLPSCFRYRVLESIVPLRNVLWTST